jgi:glycosyltransferase involved in cell wall biosynthesis
MNDSGAVAVAGLASVGLALAGRVASRRVLFPLRRPSLYRRVTDRIACVSSAVMRGCNDAGLDERSLRVVPDGVVLPPPATRERTSSPGEACLLSVGSLVRCKGHADSLRAARHMLADRPGVRWLIAGDGPDRARLEQLARELGVQQQVRFLGFREDVPELMQRADLFVHAATEEGLGSSILEAMARGLPAVVADGGGTGDLMPARPALPCGWAVPASDPEALAAAIGAALDDPAEAAMRGRRGAELVRDRFSADAMIEATLALYQEILQSGPTNR